MVVVVRGGLSCCFGRPESMCCNKLHSSHLHPRFLREIQSFSVVVDLLGIHHAAVEEFALSRLKRMNQMVWDVQCWVSRGLWMGLVYSLV